MQTNTKQIFSAKTSLNLSPFSDRTVKLNESQEWRRWGGYLSATQYGLNHENEYFAIRTKAAIIDISPLYKYKVEGNDAQLFINKIITRDINKCKIHQVMYTPWCDEYGKVIDDGTVQYLDKNCFRITCAEPNYSWLIDNGKNFNIKILDESKSIAAIALQGPNSRQILDLVTNNTTNKIKFFHLKHTTIDNVPITISRTGYTGDLGYEIWINENNALYIWDKIIEAGNNYGITPTGLQALDIARIEAGLILLDVDYISARHALIESRKSSPYELGLGWTVKLEKENFIGKQILQKEKNKWAFKGIEINWEAFELKYNEVGLAPTLPYTAIRSSIPLYKNNRQIGYATSSCWSPILKKYIALAHIEEKYSSIGTKIDFEITVEHYKHTIPATIVNTPFFNPERKTSCPK